MGQFYAGVDSCRERARKLAPRLLGEVGDDRTRFTNAMGLQCIARTAPVTKQSGKLCYQQVTARL